MKGEYNSVGQVISYFFDIWIRGGARDFSKFLLPVYLILVADKIEKSKNEDRTLTTKTHELSDEILLDFRLRCFQLPVSKKQPTSGVRSKPEAQS